MGLNATSPRSGLRHANAANVNGKGRTTLQKKLVEVTSSIRARVDAGKAVWKRETQRQMRVLGYGN